MSGEKGVLAGSPALPFENLDAVDEQLLADASPFRNRPQPIGGSRRGIPNKRNQQLRDLYLKSGLPHPLLWQGQMLRQGVDGLRDALGCTPIEAAELLRKIAADALPYIEGKQPTRVAVEGGERLPVLVVGELGAAVAGLVQAREEGALAIDDEVEGAVVAFERNQALKAADPDASQDRASHGGAKALKDR